MGTKLVNVSLCKPAHQSSQSPWSGELGAAGALQFDVQSPFGFHTSLENAPWWVCDLLCIYPIDRIVIYDRASGFSDRSKTIKVEISINEQDWILVHQGLVFINGDGPDENTPFVLPLSGKISARFVRLSLEERQYFHLKKIEILVKETDIRASEGNKRNYPLREYNPGTPKIRAAILGTSNALNGGYPEALKRANIEVVANASIGSSHSCLIPYRLADIENIDIDVLILDFHVNDQRALNGGFDFQPMTSHILDFVKNWVSRKKIIPIMLILPKKVNFESERMDAKLKLIKMCKEKKILYFDGYEIIKKISERWKRNESSFFNDEFHLNILAARTLGALLGMRINTLFSEKDRPRLQIKTRNGQVRKFAHLTTPNLAGLNHVTRQTSLITVTFTRLSKGEQVVFPVPTGASVVGLVLNMAQTSGALEIEGRTSLRKILNNDYFDIERPMWLVAWNLLEKVVAGPDGIRITCADPTPWTEFEDNDHRIKRGKSESETIVELNGIVIEYPVKNLPMTEAEISELNISNSTEFNLLAPAINV